MYLSDVINERQLKKTFTQFSILTEKISPNVQREQCSNFIAAIRYQLFGKLSQFSQILSEPLVINQIDTPYAGFEFLREEWSYYKVDIKRDGWDYSLYLGCFRIDGMLRIGLFQRNADYSVYGQWLIFGTEDVLYRFLCFTLTLTEKNETFPKEGTYYLILDDNLAFCWKKNFKDVLSFETIQSITDVKERIIINKPFEEKENVTNDS